MVVPVTSTNADMVLLVHLGIRPADAMRHRHIRSRFVVAKKTHIGEVTSIGEVSIGHCTGMTIQNLRCRYIRCIRVTYNKCGLNLTNWNRGASLSAEWWQGHVIPIYQRSLVTFAFDLASDWHTTMWIRCSCGQEIARQRSTHHRKH